MDFLAERFIKNWKTTAGGFLSVAGIVFTVFNQYHPSSEWVLIGSGIVVGLTGLLAKDK